MAKRQELESLMELEEKAIDSYFADKEGDLRGLGQELIDLADRIPNGPAFYDEAFVLIRRFTNLHSGLFNVALMREDGQMLLTGKTPYSPTLPTISDQPSFMKFREESNQDQRMIICQSMVSAFARKWIIPLRYEVKNREGNTVFILSDSLPIEMLQNFWKNAPFTQTASLALMRDDGFLISRYPVPDKLELPEIYGKPRTGTLITHLRQKGFPDHGFTEGFGSLDDREYLLSYRRLEHFPITLYITQPLSDIRAGWWDRVKVPYILFLFLLAGGFFNYRKTFNKQQKWETEMQCSRSFLECITQQSPIPKMVWDDKGTIIRVNREMCKWLGCCDEDDLVKFNILNDKQIEEQGLMPQVRDVFEKGSATRFIMNYDTSLIPNVKLTKTRRSILDVSFTSVQCTDSMIPNVIAQFLDISELKQMEKKITELNRDFVAFLENTTDFIYYKDKNCCYRFCSQSIANMTGHASWRDMIGMHTLEVFPEETSQIYHDEDVWVIREGRPLLNMVNPYYNASGEKGWLNTSKWPLWDVDGEVDGVIGISRVVTEIKRLEEEIVNINKTLEERVAQEVQRNLEQERMLIHQNRTAGMGEMLGNIAHQWRQPLNALNILFFNIKDAYQYNELDEDYINQAVADGERLVQKMSTTISDFRNFFRPDKEIKAFSVTDQIRQVMKLMQSDLDKHKISIHIDAPQDLVISGFPNEYSHVLLNLFSNARDVIVKHHPSFSRVDVVVTAQDCQGCVRVRDTGGGIPEDIMSMIFDPYFSTKEEGSGIGLYMSKMIIESHMNGSITAKNIEGGAEFSVCVPLAEIQKK